MYSESAMHSLSLSRSCLHVCYVFTILLNIPRLSFKVLNAQCMHSFEDRSLPPDVYHKFRWQLPRREVEVVERKLIAVLPLIPVGRSRGRTLGACHHQLGIQSLLVFKLRHPFPAESGYVSVPADCQSCRADLRACLWSICILICTQSR